MRYLLVAALLSGSISCTSSEQKSGDTKAPAPVVDTQPRHGPAETRTTILPDGTEATVIVIA
jgi:hypothetical protein